MFHATELINELLIENKMFDCVIKASLKLAAKLLHSTDMVGEGGGWNKHK